MKTENESFCYNKWMKCVAITFCFIYMVIFFFLIFKRIPWITSRLSLISTLVRDQNILLFVFQRTVRRSVCMCVYIYIF